MSAMPSGARDGTQDERRLVMAFRSGGGMDPPTGGGRLHRSALVALPSLFVPEQDEKRRVRRRPTLFRRATPPPLPVSPLSAMELLARDGLDGMELTILRMGGRL